MGVNTDPLPKTFVRAYFPAEDRTVFLNKKTQVAQYDHPNKDGSNERERVSPFPVLKAVKGAPVLFVVSPQPENMVEDWEQCIAIHPGKKTDWPDPDILYRNKVDKTIQMADPRPVEIDHELPEGWTEEKDSEGDLFFYDHNTGIATYDDPRLERNPEPSLQLQAIIRARFSRKKRERPLRREASSAKAWKIGPCDRDAFEDIDNNLTDVEEVPECVRNKKHNRYMDILPNPKTAVRLPSIGGDPETEYVNANYVHGPNGDPNYFVAAMGPLPSTLVHFWRMIWETNTAAIVMVTGIIEKGRKKCERYWPTEVDNKTSMTFGDISVICQNEAAAKGYNYTLLKVKRGGETRKIGHFWYNTWPDHGVPRDGQGELFTDSVLGMMHTVHKFLSKVKGRPITVHCSAGIGRTGTIIAIDYCRAALKEKGQCDPLQVIRTIRKDRCALVQHPIQFEYVHSACIRYAELHKHAYAVESTGKQQEEEKFELVRSMTIADRKEVMKSEKLAAKKRRASRRHPNLMTNAQVHGELRRKAHGAPTTEEELHEAWRLMDIDNNGHISLREAAMRGIPQSVFKQMDSDKNGFLSMDEFKAYYRKQMELERQQQQSS